MKVALFTDSNVFAGTERHMLDLAIGLRDEDVEIHVACPVPSVLAERASAVGLSVIPIAKGGLLDGAAIRSLAKLLKAGTIDLLHAHNGRTALLAAAAVALAGRGCNVSTQHFLAPAHVSRRGAAAFLSRCAHWWVNRHTKAFIAISEAARAGMLARGQAPADRIAVVPNGTPPPDLALLGSAESIRQELGIAPDALLVVSVARLEREKNLETLIAAMRAVLAAEPRAVCLIVGDGSQRETLLAQISAFGLEGRVRLIGFRSDALAVMNAGDIFVLPSAAESFGLVLIEAMSVEKPVIAMRAGGPGEIVENGETGYLVTPAAVDELANALLALLSDINLRRRMGTAGHARFMKKYTVAGMTRGTIAVYERALTA